MRTVLAILSVVVAPLLSAAPAAAQVAAPCAGTPPTGSAPIRVIDTTVSLVFEYPDADWSGIAQATLRVLRVGQTAPLSTQVVMVSAITRLGNGNGAGVGCYSLPVVPVDQIPRGLPIQFTLAVTGGEPLLESGESNRTDPLGRRLPTGVLRGSTP